MSLFDSLLRGFGARVGAEVAKQSIDKLTEPDREEEERKAKSKQKRMLAAGVVVVSALGLLVLSGVFTTILKYLLGAAFLAGLGGGAYYLGRNRLRALKARYEEGRDKKLEEKTVTSTEKSVEEQLADLKKRRNG